MKNQNKRKEKKKKFQKKDSMSIMKNEFLNALKHGYWKNLHNFSYFGASKEKTHCGTRKKKLVKTLNKIILFIKKNENNKKKME